MKLAEEIALLGEALTHPYGVVVEVPSPADLEHLRQRLYRARKTDEAFACLAFTLRTDNPRHLWIVRTRNEADGRETTEGDA